MRQLTQDVFSGAPDWVKSADVIHSGRAFYRSATKSRMRPNGLFRSLIHAEDVQGYKSQMIEQGYYDEHAKYVPATVFDATNWQNSAIDRV